MNNCANCGRRATVLLALPGEVLRLLCGGCFDDEMGEVPSVPIPDNLIQFQRREEGDDASDRE
jgi:hypothetical protein